LAILRNYFEIAGKHGVKSGQIQRRRSRGFTPVFFMLMDAIANLARNRYPGIQKMGDMHKWRTIPRIEEVSRPLLHRDWNNISIGNRLLR